nr:hypothetical protein [Tanacetum cinerariifolium]
MVITKARTLNGGSRSFLLKASTSTFAFRRQLLQLFQQVFYSERRQSIRCPCYGCSTRLFAVDGWMGRNADIKAGVSAK